MLTRDPSIVARYAFAILVVTLATIFRFALEPVLDLQVPFILYFPATVLCAWYGGLWPGVLSTILGSLVAWFAFIPPQYSFKVSDPAARAQLIIFLFAGALINLLAESLHRARRREREEREKFHVTLASIGDGVIATDSQGRVTFTNQVADSLIGWKHNEVSGKRLEEVFNIANERTREPVQNPALRAMKEEVIVGLANHTVLIAKDGTEIPIDDSGAPIKDSEGRIVGAVLIFRDITERRRAEQTRTQLSSIVESSDDAIISKDLDGVITSWNAGAERIFGYTAAEAVGQPIAIIIPLERVEEEQSIVDSLRRGARIDHFETVRLSKSGKAIDISLTVSPVRDAAGQIIGASKIARDITARKQAEEELRRQREWLRVTLSSIGDAVIATDTRGLITFLNPVAESLTGWKLEEAVEQPLDSVFNIIDEETRKPVANPALRAMEAGVTVGLANHTVLIAKDGTEIPIDDSGAPIRDSEGKVLGSVLVFRDIIERRRAETERSQLLSRERVAREHAEAASRAKDEFLAMVSHELRSPLNSILGWTDMLRTGKFDRAESAHALETVERAARAQVKLIDDLLDISRVIAGKLILNVRPVELSEIIAAVLDSIRPASDAKSIRMECHTDPGGSWVSADPNRLQQIVWNLLSNAVKFSPERGHIEVNVARIDSYIELTVSDSGAGIPPDFLPYVFDRFSQASTTTERNHGGLGLGLAIVRHLVESHGGTVRAASSGEGQGASFTVTLPVSTVHAEMSEFKRTYSSAASPSLIEEAALDGLRVLIVDDDTDTRELLTAILTVRRAEVRACASASEALDAIQSWRPLVIVSDIGMPLEDGYSLIRKLRQLEPELGGNIPAVAVTGYAGSEDRKRALAAGFQTHVTKPIEAEELIIVIASLTGRTGRGMSR